MAKRLARRQPVDHSFVNVALYIVRRTRGALIVILILIGVILLMVQHVNLAPLRH